MVKDSFLNCLAALEEHALDRLDYKKRIPSAEQFGWVNSRKRLMRQTN